LFKTNENIMKLKFAGQIKSDILKNQFCRKSGEYNYYNAFVSFNQTPKVNSFPDKKTGNMKTKENFGAFYGLDENSSKVYIGNVEKVFINEIPSAWIRFDLSIKQNGMDKMIELAYKGNKNYFNNVAFDIEFDPDTVSKRDQVGTVSVKNNNTNKYEAVGSIRFISSEITSEQETVITAQAAKDDDDLPF